MPVMDRWVAFDQLLCYHCRGRKASSLRWALDSVDSTLEGLDCHSLLYNRESTWVPFSTQQATQHIIRSNVPSEAAHLDNFICNSILRVWCLHSLAVLLCCVAGAGTWVRTPLQTFHSEGALRAAHQLLTSIAWLHVLFLWITFAAWVLVAYALRPVPVPYDASCLLSIGRTGLGIHPSR